MRFKILKKDYRCKSKFLAIQIYEHISRFQQTTFVFVETYPLCNVKQVLDLSQSHFIYTSKEYLNFLKQHAILNSSTNICVDIALDVLLLVHFEIVFGF